MSIQIFIGKRIKIFIRGKNLGILGSAALVAPIAIIGGGIYGISKIETSSCEEIKKTAAKIIKISLNVVGFAFCSLSAMLYMGFAAGSVYGVFAITHHLITGRPCSMSDGPITIKDLAICSVAATVCTLASCCIIKEVVIEVANATLEELRS